MIFQNGPQPGLIALLGHPVSHSLSPRMHEAGFRALGLTLRYMAFDVPEERFASALQGLRALGALGANVTLPYKELAASLCDSLDPLAERIGAVNCVAFEGGGMRGSNTDAPGFLAAIDEEGWSLDGARVLILGAGGAARAVAHALCQRKLARLSILNRGAERARQLAASLGELDFELALEPDPQAELVINGLSRGVAPPIVPGRGQRAFDLNTGSSAWLEEAARAGAEVIDGRGMLLHQGALAWPLWLNKKAPVEAMRLAMTEAFSESSGSQ